MRRSREGFLPAFFITLFIAFAVAVFLRIRSYQDDPPPASTTATESTAEQLPDSDPLTASTPVAAPSEPTIVERATKITPRAGSTTSPAAPRMTTPPPLAIPTASAPARVGSAEKPSLIARVVDALRPDPPPRTQTAPQQPQQQRTTQQRNTPADSTSGSSSTTDTTASQPPLEQDGTSDSVPPQLAAVEFVPPQVQDGEETTLIVTAIDNLTGVQSISGTIVAPSGAIQGFACQRDGETNRYLSRITVPREAAEGLWRVNYLNLVDKASNATALTAQQGTMPPTASFRVTSSRPDTEGPTLRAIWIDRRAMRGGEKNTVFIDAADEKSGVNLVTGVLQSPSKFARVGFICKSGTTWNCEINAPVCADCGDWTLEQIQMQDRANNMTTIRNNNELVASIRIDISSESCDANPPAVESISLSRKVISNSADSIIAVFATLSDDACGVLSVSGQAVGPATNGPPPRRYFSLTAAGDARTWRGDITMPRLAAKGVWRISFVQVLDRGHNLRTYGQADAVLADAVFTVQ